MAIIKRAELWYPHLDPQRPNNRFDKENPQWDIQLRTSSKVTKAEWEALGIKTKAVIPDDGPAYWTANLRKRTLKRDGSSTEPVKVVDGSQDYLDPNTIGNGSVGNIRIYQYEGKDKAGSSKLVAVLMEIQVTKLIKYKHEPRESFTNEDTEIIDPRAHEIEEDSESETESTDTVITKSAHPADAF